MKTEEISVTMEMSSRKEIFEKEETLREPVETALKVVEVKPTSVPSEKKLVIVPQKKTEISSTTGMPG